MLTLQSGQNLQAVYFSSTSNGYAVGGNTVFSTTDGGTTWAAVFTGESTVWRENYLVCRLDGYQNQDPAYANDLPFDVKRMIDDASDPDSQGLFVLDKYPGQIPTGNEWLDAAHSILTSMGVNSALDATTTYITNSSEVMGYASWGSNDWNSPANTQWAKPGHSWQKGSISTTYVSSCGRTLNYPPDYANPVPTLSSSLAPAGYLQISGCWQGWTGLLHNNETGQDIMATSNASGFMDFPLSESISNGYLKIFYPDGSEITTARIIAPASSLAPRNKYSLGYQSLIADLIREGCDASVGNVWEPGLGGCAQPQYLFPRYASGYTWAEAVYMSMAQGGWMEIAVGDPLMAAYATPPDVTLDSPSTDGAVISGTSYTVTATATPNGASSINRVEFWLSNGEDVDALVGTDTSSPYSISLDTTTLPASYNSQAIPDGRYVLEAIAYEENNPREVGRAWRPVVINNGGSPTTVSITTPGTDGTTLSSVTAIQVSATPSGLPETARVDLWLNGAKRDMLIGSIPAGQSYGFSFNTASVPDSEQGTYYSLQAVAYSSTGQASASPVRLIAVDNSSLIQITEPSTDGQQKSGTFTITATTNQSASVSKVEFWLGGTVDQGTRLTTITSAPYTYNFDSTVFVSGDYVIRALAYTTGESIPKVVTRTVTINNTNLLSFSLPSSDGQTVSGSLSVQTTADSSIDRVDLWPYGNEEWTITSTDTSSPFNWSLDTTVLANGTRTLRAYGYKQDVRLADTHTRTIVVNNPNLLSISQPAADGDVVSGNTTIVVNAQTTTPDYGRMEIWFSGETSPWVVTSRPFEYTFNTASYTDGIYTVTVYAFKPDGRRVMNSSASRTFLISNQHTDCATIKAARLLADSAGALLQRKVVSAGTGATMDNAFYLEESNRSAGIRVAWTGAAVTAGKEVTVMGSLRSNSSTGERELAADTVYVGANGTVPNPVALNNRDLGGSAPADESYTNGITDVHGLYNVGLLVKVFGSVTYVGDTYFYIDDGSGLLDGNSDSAAIVVPLDGSQIPGTYPPIKGIRIYAGSLKKPGIGDYVAVTGVSSTQTIGANIVRYVRMRSQSDLTSYISYTRCAKASGGVYKSEPPELATLPVGTKVRMVDAYVQQNFGSTFSVLHTDYWIGSWLYSTIVGTTALAYNDLVTILGTIESDGQGGYRIQADAIYKGGSTYGALSINPGDGSAGMGDSKGLPGGGLFDPWPGPTVEEILASPWFQEHYYQEGAIGWALAQPDGTVIDLLGEQVTHEWYDGLVFGLKEAFEPGVGAPKLLLYLDSPIKGLGNRMYSVDVIGGTLTTLDNGQRALVRPKAVYAYTDQRGHYMFAVPWFKWLRSNWRFDESFNCWPWKVQIAP